VVLRRFPCIMQTTPVDVVHYTRGMQLPQQISSSILSADGPLQAEDSSPMGTAPIVAAAGQHGMQPAATTGPSPWQQAKLPSSPAKAAAAQAGAVAASTSSGGGANSTDQGVPPRHAPSPAGTVVEIEEEYEQEDLDEDWRALLGGVDARLKLQGAGPLNARERAIAIKTLLVATGTRGVEFALNSTLQVGAVCAAGWW
jgi:hypothetical protein